MKLTIFLSFIIPIFILGCSSLNDSSETTIPTINENIKVSLFQHLLPKGKSSNKNSFKLKTYQFLTDEGRDPSVEIMSRLKNMGHVAYPYSLAKVIEGEREIIILDNDKEFLRSYHLSGTLAHKDLGGFGASISLGEVEWVTKNKVIVPWNSHVSGLNGSANIATLELKNGKWVVTNNKITGVA